MARLQYGDAYFFLKKQLIAAMIGYMALLIFTQIDPRTYRQWIWPFYFICLVLLVMVFVPGIGKKAGGASRWIQIGGYSLQPSDLVKLSLILVLARIYADRESETQIDAKLILISLGVMILPVLLIAVEEDLGTAIHLVLTCGALLLFTRFPLKIHAIGFFVFLAGIIYMIKSTPFRLERLKAFLDPWEYRFDSAFQLVASMKSFLTGGFWGKGLGEGLRRHNLQERHTDFIVAVVAEDLGALGVIVLFAAYFSFAIYGLIILSKIRDDFTRLVGTGIVISLIFQVFINAAVAMGLLPTKGINLPLVSNGGTSLVVYMAMCGIFLSACRRV